MDASSLQDSIKEYKKQVLQVQCALATADGSNRDDLQKLLDDLQQLIQLSEESLLGQQDASHTTGKHGGPQTTNQSTDLDSELALFDAEMAALGGEASTSTGATSTTTTRAPDEDDTEDQSTLTDYTDDTELTANLAALEGTKCRAPFSTGYGHLGYHNSVILSVDYKTEGDVQVRVMFSHPCVPEMKPCPYYLEDKCRFSRERCRFSHGHDVPLSDIQEYIEPNVSMLQSGSRCLVLSDGGLWAAAAVECSERMEDNEMLFTVKFNQNNAVTTVSSTEILPLEAEDVSSESESELYDPDDDDDVTTAPSTLALAPSTLVAPEFGDWEKHTRGIGSKLMAKMGYITGQGLGCRGGGRLDPVEAVVLPAGKSLDKCMEYKELAKNGDPVKAMKKIMRKKRREEKKITKGYTRRKQQRPTNVFDFLNSKIGQSVGSTKNHGKVKNNRSDENLKTASDKRLNVESLQLMEEIRKTENSIRKLKLALERNQSRDRFMASNLRDQISFQERQLSELRSSERRLHGEQSTRNNQQKMSIF